MEERILITVKTYPNLTSQHGELVCTAGITESGEWRRIYPVPFRKLGEVEQFRKFEWIRVNLTTAAPKDTRPESRKLAGEIKKEGFVEKYPERNGIIFSKAPVYRSRAELLNDLREKGTSLAIFKPAEVVKMDFEKTDSEWSPDKLAAFQRDREQYELFSTAEEHRRRYFHAAQKIPFVFRYVYEDADGNRIRMMVEDWEIGMLYLNSLKSKRCHCPEDAARMTVERYMKFAREKDIFFFLGTSWERQQKNAPNPFVIIGVYYPPKPGPDTGQPWLF